MKLNVLLRRTMEARSQCEMTSPLHTKENEKYKTFYSLIHS